MDLVNGEEVMGFFWFDWVCDVYVLLVIVNDYLYVVDCDGIGMVVNIVEVFRLVGRNCFDDCFSVLLVFVEN